MAEAGCYPPGLIFTFPSLKTTDCSAPLMKNACNIFDAAETAHPQRFMAEILQAL